MCNVNIGNRDYVDTSNIQKIDEDNNIIRTYEKSNTLDGGTIVKEEITIGKKFYVSDTSVEDALIDRRMRAFAGYNPSDVMYFVSPDSIQNYENGEGGAYISPWNFAVPVPSITEMTISEVADLLRKHGELVGELKIKE